ncbi:MAG: AI-2E family transporter [Armatimonadetes bacterium]|nr:AI-2E family transporter [Armatimonadota bacterium]
MSLTPTQDELPVRGRGLAAAALLLLLFLLLLYLVRRVLAPFLIAVAIAALLDPLMERLQVRGLRRVWSVIIVYLLFFVAFGAFLTWIVPLTWGEVQSLVSNWPGYLAQFKDSWTHLSHSPLIRRLPLEVPQTYTELTSQLSHYINTVGPRALQNTLGGVIGTAGYLVNIVIILLATFYLLNDWPKLRRRVHYVIPPQFRDQVVDVMDRVGAVFLGYLRGLVTLCGLYGISITVALSLLGVQYVLVLGLAASLLYAVPYVGSISLIVLSGTVALVGSGGDLQFAGVVMLVVLALNQVFDSFLTPKILGKSTGLHPLISLFALMAGSQLFGLVGFIIGVPVAASIAIVASTLYPRLSEPIPDYAHVPPEKRAAQSETKLGHEEKLADATPATGEPLTGEVNAGKGSVGSDTPNG